MTWLALSDHMERRLSLRGIGTDKRPHRILPDDPDAMLQKGSLMFETRLSPEGGPQVLFGYQIAYPEIRSLEFSAIPGGGVSLVQVKGEDISHAAIRRKTVERTDVLRITYSWDAPRGWGCLTLETPEETDLISVPVETPPALCLEDIRILMLGKGTHTFAPDMIFAALSDQIEPVGPTPTLSLNAPVATPWGYVAASNLQRGDTVIGPWGQVIPVLHNVTRTVPARGSFEPIEMRNNYFGLLQDVIIAPHQRIVVDGPEVEYMFDHESVLMSARHLLNDFSAFPAPAGSLVTYTQLVLPGHETIDVAGTPMESLFIGELADDADLVAASLFRGVNRNGLPRHMTQSHRVLEWYEAITLAKKRAA